MDGEHAAAQTIVQSLAWVHTVCMRTCIYIDMHPGLAFAVFLNSTTYNKPHTQSVTKHIMDLCTGSGVHYMQQQGTWTLHVSIYVYMGCPNPPTFSYWGYSTIYMKWHLCYVPVSVARCNMRSVGYSCVKSVITTQSWTRMMWLT